MFHVGRGHGGRCSVLRWRHFSIIFGMHTPSGGALDHGGSSPTPALDSNRCWYTKCTDGDILIHCGDFSTKLSQRDFETATEDFDRFLGSLPHPHKGEVPDMTPARQPARETAPNTASRASLFQNL